MSLGFNNFNFLLNGGCSPLGGFNPCGGYFNVAEQFGQYWGAQVAQTGMSVFGTILAARLSNSNSSSEGGSSSKLATIEQEMQAQIKILNKDGNYNAETGEKPVIHQKYQDAIDAADKKIQTAKTEIDTKNADIKIRESKLKEPKEADFKDSDGTLNEAAYKEELIKYEKEKREIEEAKAEVKKLEDSIKETGELGKALIAAKNAKTARETEINTAFEKLQQLEEQKQAEIDKNGDNVINAGDGNGTSRLFSPNKRKVHEFLEAKQEYDKLQKPTKTAYGKLKAAYEQLPRDSKSGSTRTAVQYADEYFKNIKEPNE